MIEVPYSPYKIFGVEKAVISLLPGKDVILPLLFARQCLIHPDKAMPPASPNCFKGKQGTFSLECQKNSVSMQIYLLLILLLSLHLGESIRTF